MVKFGKDFRNKQREEWKKEYIDYKGLKQLIKQIKENFENLENTENNLEFNQYEDLRIKSPTNSLNSKKIMKEGEEIQVNKGDEYLKQFIKQLDSEIKKIYFFFVNREKELYVEINSHLHIRQNYDAFNLNKISKEFKELNKIAETTSIIIDFISMNMIAVKKILKKFDKKFKKDFGIINLKYVKNKLQSKNSDLLYIMQFKIIDEVNALLEDLMSDLNSKFLKRKGKGQASKKNSISDQIKTSEEVKEQLIEGIELSDDFNMNEHDLIVTLNNHMKQLQFHLNQIDDANQNFRTEFKDWNPFIKQLTSAYNNASITNNTSLDGISVKDINNLGYQKVDFQRNPRTNLTITDIESAIIFSNENNSNIRLILFHTFIFLFSYSIVLPTNIFYISSLGYSKMLSGLVMACTPMGTLISLFYTNKWIKITYKLPTLVAISMMVVGNFLYILSSAFNHIAPMIIGRFLLGLGSNRIANKNYIIEFIPKAHLSTFLMYFHFISITGLAAGPLISIMFQYFDNFGFGSSGIFGVYTNPAWLCVILSCILLVFVFTSYTEPLSSEFSMAGEGSSSTIRTSSIISKETMSKKDRDMIEKIDDKLSEINDMNKFSDTNLVARSIEQIAWKEKKTTSYLYKCFLVFFCIIFVCRLTADSLLVITPYYIHDLSPQTDNKLTALLLSFSVFLVIPFGFFFTKFLSFRLRDRRMLLYLIIFSIIFNIFILNMFYVSLVQYSISLIFLIISSNLLENVATTMFSKIIPSDYEINSHNAGFIIQISSTIGKILGCLMLTLAGFVTDENLNRITYSITLGLFICILLITALYYSELRVKAIARILRFRTRKLKTTEL